MLENMSLLFKKMNGIMNFYILFSCLFLEGIVHCIEMSVPPPVLSLQETLVINYV